MAGAAATSQINARIDASLKKNGDDALAKAGFTPTQAIRALWELAERYSDRPDRLRKALLPAEARQSESAESKRRKQMAKIADTGPDIVRGAYAQAGLTWPPEESSPSFDQLKALAFEERYGSEMGWS